MNQMAEQSVIGSVDGMWIPIFFWVLTAAVAFLLYKWMRDASREDDTPPAKVTHENAREILEKRFARGEIDQATYERMLRELNDEAS